MTTATHAQQSPQNQLGLLSSVTTHVNKAMQPQTWKAIGKSVLNAAQKDSEQATTPQDKSPITWTPSGKAGVVKDPGSEPNGGARLRSGPSTASTRLTWLPQNTKVRIDQEGSNDWLQVIVDSGADAGRTGFISAPLIAIPPDTGAILYDISTGDTLATVIAQSPQYKNYEYGTGNDFRTIAMAIYMANPDNEGIKLDPQKLQDAKAKQGFKERLDAHRRELSPIYQSIELFPPGPIWLPGIPYIESLRTSGAIAQRADIANQTIAVAKGTGGFIEGVATGFVKSFVDAVLDIGEIVGDLQKIVSGEAYAAIVEFFDAVSKMTVEELKVLAGEFAGAIKNAILQGAEEFSNKWNSFSPYDRWYFRGSIVGMIVAEIVMLLVSGGVANAAKAALKSAKVGRSLIALLRKAQNAVKKVLPKNLGRKPKRPDIDADTMPNAHKSGDKKPVENHHPTEEPEVKEPAAKPGAADSTPVEDKRSDTELDDELPVNGQQSAHDVDRIAESKETPPRTSSPKLTDPATTDMDRPLAPVSNWKSGRTLTPEEMSKRPSGATAKLDPVAEAQKKIHKRTRRLFRAHVKRTLSKNENHPLAKLWDYENGTFTKEANGLFDAGRRAHQRGDSWEIVGIEFRDWNQAKGKFEKRGLGPVSKFVDVGGIPVERKTAKKFLREGIIESESDIGAWHDGWTPPEPKPSKPKRPQAPKK